MPGLTAPFAPEVEQAIREPLEHYCRLTARTRDGQEVVLEVDAENLRISVDESWAPMWQLRATIKTPAPADLALLDAVEGRRLVVDWGYIYRGNVRDIHVGALDLALIKLTESAGTGTCELEADSDETLVQEALRMPADAPLPRSGINELVSFAANQGTAPETALVVSDYNPGHRSEMLSQVGLEPGEDYYSIISDAANRCGVWVYCDADRRWRITARPRVAGLSAHQLRGGPDGTMTARTGENTREGYANTVLLRYVWTDANRTEYTIYGTATAPGTGKHGNARIGRIGYVEDRTGPITQQQADAAAQTVLSYRLTRGSGQRVEAIAAYWLRPGMTVTVETLLGLVRHLVRSIEFSPLTGGMTLTTRDPNTEA